MISYYDITQFIQSPGNWQKKNIFPVAVSFLKIISRISRFNQLLRKKVGW